MSAVPTDSGRRLNRAAPNDAYDIKKESCATCRFWQPNQNPEIVPGDGPIVPSEKNVDFGFCRRNPPVIVNRLTELNIDPPRYGEQRDADEGFNATATFDSSSFPGTFFTEWCGRFEWLKSLEPMGPLC